MDIAIIFNTITHEAPALLEKLYQLTASRLATGILKQEELKLSVGGRYYRHINFQKLGI
ncbi:MAG: hypothetical protein IID18_07945 [Nitrospinae bacterium]|nr:hypothetical protein [Nitrospinota bacterium]